MKEGVKRFILNEKLIDAGDRVLLGCSGGADSMCLLHLLSEFMGAGDGRMDFELAVVHVHHHLRGRDADEDAVLVEETCQKLRIPCLILHKDVLGRKEEERLSLEEAARLCRYEAFEEAAGHFRANKLALAHHMEDRAETMLFQMIRGSGLRGSAGMQPKRLILISGKKEKDKEDEDPKGGKTITLIRPLLMSSKQEILSYNEENGILWREDSSNKEEDLTRNRIRHKVLPALKDVREDAVEKLNELGIYFTEVDDYLRREARAWISVYMRSTDGEIPEDPFKDTPKILQEYIVTEMLRLKNVPMKDLRRVHIDGIAGLIHAQVGKRIRLAKTFSMIRTYTGIEIRTDDEKDPENDEDEDRIGSKTGTGSKVEKEEALRLETHVFPNKKGVQIPQKEYTKWFDYDKIKGPLELRTRKTGDLFSQATGAHKKLKDFFIDEKIPREERDRIPLVAVGSDVLWVVGVRMSEAYKVTEETENIIEITIRREEK